MRSDPEDVVVASSATELQVERIVQSETFRNAEALRRLFRFLTERLLKGDAEDLKEYSVGVDALGKPADYDPRQDSTVRIQTSRLRQKLAEYYMTEGLNDPCIIELPKGHFKLKIAMRPVSAPPQEAKAAPEPATVPSPERSRRLVYVLAGVTAAALVWATISTVLLTNTRRNQTAAEWTPALEQLWAPFLSADRPVLVAIEDPPFVQFAGYGVYREIGLNRWEDIEKSENIAKIRKALGNADIKPSHYFAPVGEGSAAFLLGKFLGPRVPSLSLAGIRDLSWQKLASNNVLYVGASVFFNTRFKDLPVGIDFDHLAEGVTNAHPRPGELAFYPEPEPGGRNDVTTNGERYALVTHIPGPSGTGEVTNFSSMRTTARLGAVQWLTDPVHAAELVEKMKGPDGRLPRYYQVLLKVKFQENVPIETTYVLHHELTARAAH